MKTPTVPLTNWLTDLRRHGAHLAIHPNGTVTIHGRPPERTDPKITQRHRHALTVAAAGTHPDWWNTVLGNQPAHPDLELPATDDGEFACACCAAPAAWLDPHLLGWCDQHVDLEAL